MKKVGWVIVGGVAAFGIALYAYVRKQAMLLENYTYKIVDLKIETFDLQKIKGKISVFFGSQADIEVLVEEFYLDFYFNNEKVGYLQDDTKFVIPAKGSTVIPLGFTLNPQIIFSNATDIFAYTFSKKDAAISIRGFAKLRSGFISATLPIEYDSTIREILAD